MLSVKTAYQVALRLIHQDGAERSNARMDGKDKLTKTELERWATTSWAIWNARNKYFFERVQMQPRTIMDHATGLLEDYQRLAASQNTS
ncbi:hypothetical protein SO802_008830 [Lithocarpus litseifolius]|uniref:Uncharacterized protein n=1 Tax=Lithocarpus litseifolius TaxID=425828 RepID=A0AAW2DCI7_9ROSI